MIAALLFACALPTASALSVTTKPTPAKPVVASAGDADLLVRAARGEDVERTPVWLMRQAGRYMADFRKYSDKIPFRERSESPDIATELSLQCWRAFGVDGAIMFSTSSRRCPPAPTSTSSRARALITDTLGDAKRIAAFVEACGGFDPARSCRSSATLRNLRKETEGKTSLVGFVGAPWTLCAYATEGGASRHALKIKALMHDEPALAHAALDAMADAVAAYAIHQIDEGAQMVQVFESWAHQLNPADFAAFSKPYALRVAAAVREAHPGVPRPRPTRRVRRRARKHGTK
ncbi:uroporphyrinogen decarboxylase [Aureococcus anophagefferens]|nr:uroporphyrinogen decarboxylase [Aureococcus anophagefferens]